MLESCKIELREVAVNTAAVTLGKDIRQARERLQMTQTELAGAVGVSESSVSNWERGRSSPKNRLALVRQVLRMDDDGEVAVEDWPNEHMAEEDLLREVSDSALWAEVTRRFFRAAKSVRTDEPKRGHHGALPSHLLDSQASERRESDL